MTLRHGLAAALLALTATTATAGIGDTVPRPLEQHQDFPRPMPGRFQIPEVQNFWDSLKDWFRPKLGTITPRIIINAEEEARQSSDGLAPQP